MKNDLITLSNKHKLVNISNKIASLEENIELKIGFLGEFSSGKSTLINALLDKKVLPSMDKPTSKSIIEIQAKKNLDKTLFYKLNEENKKEEISAIEFSEIALSNGESKALLEVTENEFFQDGYKLIDTPGISSLDKSDSDITYGYLPFLDCAVICNHIQKGSLTQSIINFLLKEEIKPIINNLLFVITNAHSKSTKAQEKIREEIVQQLITLNQTHELGMKNIDSKVMVISALEAMNREKSFSLNELKESFKNNFMLQKTLLLEERTNKELTKISSQILEALEYKKENTHLDLSELKEKESVLEEETELLEKEKHRVIKSLEEIDKKIQIVISGTLTDYLPRMKHIKNSDDAPLLMEEMNKTISLKVNKIISNHFKSVKCSPQNGQFMELENTISDLLKSIDMGKDIGMVVLVELLTLGTAGMGGILGFFLRSTSQMLLNQKGDSRLKETAIVIDKVNPFQFIGDKVGEYFIESKLNDTLEPLSTKISKEITEEIAEKIEEEIFKPLSEKIKNKELMLNQIYKEKSEKFENFTTELKSLKSDIVELKVMKDCNV